MAKFTLFPTGRNSNDPLGGDPVIVDVPDDPSTPGTFKLTKDSFLPAVSLPAAAPRPFFDDDVPISPQNRLLKINLVPVAAENDFAGLGNIAPSPSARFEKFNLTPTETFDYAGLGGDSPKVVDDDAPFTKNTVGDFQKFQRFAKLVDTDQGPMVWGVAAHEEPDLDNEICSYDDAKEAYQAWSHAAHKRTTDAGQEPSLGNVRLQHGIEIGGKVVKVGYDDDNKRIMLGSVPLNDQVLSDLRNGFYTGYSQGGSYAWRKCSDCGKNLTLQQANNFCPACKKNVPVQFGLKRLSEVSYVDSPCTGKGFDYVKNDGSSRFVSFAKRTEPSRGAGGIQVLGSVRLFGNVFKHHVSIAGRKRIFLMRGDDILLTV